MLCVRCDYAVFALCVRCDLVGLFCIRVVFALRLGLLCVCVVFALCLRFVAMGCLSYSSIRTPKATAPSCRKLPCIKSVSLFLLLAVSKRSYRLYTHICSPKYISMM